MRAIMFVLEFAVPLCFAIWFVVDIIVPAFTSALDPKSKKEYSNFFWFFKSVFASKPKHTLAEEVEEAERAFNDAKKKMEDLKRFATSETAGAKELIRKAEKAFETAKTNLEKLKGEYKPEAKTETTEPKK